MAAKKKKVTKPMDADNLRKKKKPVYGGGASGIGTAVGSASS